MTPEKTKQLINPVSNKLFVVLPCGLSLGPLGVHFKRSEDVATESRERAGGVKARPGEEQVESCFEWSEDDQQNQFLGFLAIGIDHFAVGDIDQCLPFSTTEKNWWGWFYERPVNSWPNRGSSCSKHPLSKASVKSPAAQESGCCVQGRLLSLKLYL